MKQRFNIIMTRELIVKQSRTLSVVAPDEETAIRMAEKRCGMAEGDKQPLHYKRKWRTEDVILDSSEIGLAK